MRWLVLLLALDQALWIDVPFVQQDKDGCGSASVWMVMEYWKQSTPDLEEIQRQLYSKQAGGVFARDMEQYFEGRGYRVFTFRGAWADVEHHISQGRPLIVCLEKNARGAPLHYVVVAGVDPVQNLVLVNDPAQRKLLSMRREDFERGWAATENWTLLAVPEVELAGAAFRDEKLSEAKEHLNTAVRSNPSDAYANDFLATVYFLQNNMESALKYWNRASQPVIENVRIDPPLEIDPVLLDHAFAFSRGSVLTLDEFRTTKARLEATGLFSRYQLELSPAENNRFDLTLRAAERNGANFLSWFAGLPYQTLSPGFFNMRKQAVNLKSMLRWDSNKRREFVSVTTPLHADLKWRLGLSFDGRQENWIDPAGGVFHMRKAEAAAEIHSTPNGRWNWTSGASVSSRHFSNALPGGLAVKYRGVLTRTLVQDSDRRVKGDSRITVETGKLFDRQPARFTKIQNDASMRWLPSAEGPRYELSAAAHSGRAFGSTPFDERFVLGLDRDSDLWLRAHSAVRDGLKNSGNVTRSFLVTNTDFQKVIQDAGLLRWSVGPFLDTARSSGLSEWAFDAGLQLRIVVLGSLTLNVSYGKSLRDSAHAFYFGSSR